MAGLDVLAPEMSATVFPIEELGAEQADVSYGGWYPGQYPGGG